MKVTIDTSGFSYVNGMIAGIAQGVSGQSYINSILNYSHASLNQEFEAWMDALAATRPENLGHVYEWGQLGTPGGRLWESVLRGRGANKTSTVIWKASKKAVPVDPKLLEPGPTGKSVKPGVHIFYWKAPVSEMGLQITVAPQKSGNGTLAYVGSDGELRFTTRPSHFEAGGGKTKGQFTMAYATFWNSIAQKSMNARIVPEIQAKLGAPVGKVKTRRTTKLSISSDRTSYQLGKNLGAKGLALQTRSYEQAAAARRLFLYGN